MNQPHDKQKLIPTPAQERSLRKFYYGTQVEKQQVIQAHSHNPEMQEKLRLLMTANNNMDKLFAIMFSDLKCATSQMKANPQDQFWRRTAIRTLAATLDGMIYCIKQNVLAAGRVGGYSFDDEEIFFLTEEVTDKSKEMRLRMPGFRDNIKRTFKVFSKIYNAPCTIDFGTSGFESLCYIYELRSELMHPKSSWSFAVNEEQKKKAGEALKWFHENFDKLFESCNVVKQIL